MLDNVHLVAVTRIGQDTNLLHIPLHQSLQRQLADELTAQRDAFSEGMEEVAFDAGYTPDEHERFRLENYDSPSWLVDTTSRTVARLESVSNDEDNVERIKGIAVFAIEEEGHEVVLFQNFSRSHVIKPGRFLFLQNNTYESSTRPGLTLDSKLAAILWPADGKLLFRNFRITNTFLPLTDFYEEASEHQIREVLNHEMIVAEDVDALVAGANQWFRKRFAMLRDSKILDDYSVSEIVEHSQGYEVHIQVDDDRIVFPAEKLAAKRLLQFLNEEIFRGAISEKLFETNSKREAD